jgi:hypothetical protein
VIFAELVVFLLQFNEGLCKLLYLLVCFQKLPVDAGQRIWGLTAAPLFELFLYLALRVWKHRLHPKKEFLGTEVQAHVGISMLLGEIIEGSSVPQADSLVVPFEQ